MYIPRLTFHKINKNSITKEQGCKEKVRINLDESQTAENFWKVIGFLLSFKDLVEHDQFLRTFRVVESSAYIVEFESKALAEKIRVLADLIERSDLSADQIDEILKQSREKTLRAFKRLLEDASSHKIYRTKYQKEIKGSGEESIWHHFLKKHHWLLGLNVDIRFIRDLEPEANVGVANTSGRGSPNADFIGFNDYTTLIELKTPRTMIFSVARKSTSRANTWSFSDDFIDGVSQCLGQKFDWDKSHKTKGLVSKGKLVDQDMVRTVDPKTILLIGNKKVEFPESSKDVEDITKRDTFERFRRNSRNLEILTFDELYERAYFLVHNKVPDN